MADTGSRSSANGTAAAAVIQPLVLAHWPGMQLIFGRFAAGGGGTVVIDPATGAGSTTGEVAFVSGSATAIDFFTVTGDLNRVITIDTGGGTVRSGANAMAFTTRTTQTTRTIRFASGIFFSVGGTLSVDANQAPGTYTGTYPVTVTYQ